MTPSIGLKVPLVTNLPLNDAGLQNIVLDMIRSKMDGAQNPSIIVDGGMYHARSYHNSPYLTN
jgi:hypothetical protein